uniref:Alternative protein ESR1 n=1 Tax=Homo sapiens TaxID=9606 RepID=L8E8A8_HUMAN|nr:alternative protein ESR1 [Homo sapiens]
MELNSTCAGLLWLLENKRESRAETGYSSEAQPDLLRVALPQAAAT